MVTARRGDRRGSGICPRRHRRRPGRGRHAPRAVGGAHHLPGGGTRACSSRWTVRTIWLPCTPRWSAPRPTCRCWCWEKARTCSWPTPASPVSWCASGRVSTGSRSAAPRCGPEGAPSFPVVARQSGGGRTARPRVGGGRAGIGGRRAGMNAGGHGSDTAAVLGAMSRLRPAHRQGPRGGPRAASALGYRTSSLGAGEVVVWAEFVLPAGERDQAEETVAEVVRWRRANQPGGSNAGSVFTNPAGDSAGRLVESAGLKGLRSGHGPGVGQARQLHPGRRGGPADDVLPAHRAGADRGPGPDRRPSGPRGPHGRLRR